MAGLNYSEKDAIEKLFAMSSGYVLDFTNRTFKEFILDSVRVDIYELYQGSKATCLRSFIKDSDERKVGRLLHDLLEYYTSIYPERFKGAEDEKYYKICMKAVNRLLAGEVSLELPEVEDLTIKSIMEEVKNAIDRDKPEAALDRLHTFATKFIRDVCERHEISTQTTNRGAKTQKPLHSLLGELVKKYSCLDIIKSETVITILKSNISIMDKYNNTRNDESMAHDNVLLESIEAEYIVKSVCNILIFIDKVERYIIPMEKRGASTSTVEEQDYDLPF